MSYSISAENCVSFYPFTSNYDNYATTPEGVTDFLENINMTLIPTDEFSNSLGVLTTSDNSFKIPSLTFSENGINISFWYKLNDLNGVSGFSRIAFDFSPFCVFLYPGGDISTTQGGLYLYYTNAGQIGPFYYVQDTNWHFYSFNFKNENNVTSIDIIVDGVVVATSPDDYVSLQQTNNYVGAKMFDGVPNFSMNNFMIFNRSLTDEELNILYEHPTDFTLDYSYSINNQTNLTNFLSSNVAYEATLNSNINIDFDYMLLNGTSQLKYICSDGTHDILKSQPPATPAPPAPPSM
jgi:hypothetical protein